MIDQPKPDVVRNDRGVPIKLIKPSQLIADLIASKPSKLPPGMTFTLHRTEIK